jgi:hypothetical protein
MDRVVLGLLFAFLLFFDSTRLGGVVGAFAVLLMLIAGIRKWDKTVLTLMLIVLVLSLRSFFDTALGFYGITHALGKIVLFILVLNSISNVPVDWVYSLGIRVVYFELVVTLLQKFDFLIYFGKEGVPNGTLTSANNLATLLGLLLVFVMTEYDRLGIRRVLKVGIPIAFMLLFILDSVTTLLALFITAVAFNLKKIRLTYFLFLIISVPLILLGFYSTFSDIVEKLNTYSLRFVLNSNGIGLGSLLWRIWAWNNYIVLSFQDIFSFLFGHGLGVTNKNNMNFIGHIVGQDPHNSYVSILLEFGLFGLLIFLKFFQLAYKILPRKRKIVLFYLMIAIFPSNSLLSIPVVFFTIFILNADYVRNYPLS